MIACVILVNFVEDRTAVDALFELVNDHCLKCKKIIMGVKMFAEKHLLKGSAET